MEMTAVHFWAVDIRKLSPSVFQSLNLFVCKLEVVTEKELVVTKRKRGWGGWEKGIKAHYNLQLQHRLVTGMVVQPGEYNWLCNILLYTLTVSAVEGVRSR